MRQEQIPRILEGGLVLAVPGGIDEQGLHLRLADRGRRLFLQGDAKLSAALHHLVFGKQHSIASYMKGAQAERQRIVRDLHDEVAGKLLAMKLIAPEERYGNLAEDALKALRGVIYSLDSPKAVSLQDASVHWHSDIHERCEANGRGLLNIAQRMSEMDGRMDYIDDRDTGMFQLRCIQPIEAVNAEDTGR